MKTKILLALVVSSFIIRHSSFAQGALTPPGAPGPTMLTLSQIEPRTPISSAPFTISQPGAYYLTTNIVSSFSDAIIITTNNVTLDLNGFTIASSYSGNAGSGIWLNGGNMNIAIFNGHIVSGTTNNGANIYSGPGFFNGIYYSLPAPQNVRVSDLTVSGTSYYGIYLGTGNSTLVQNCQAHAIGSYGIWASTVKSSTALDIGSTAITGDQVSDCRGQSTAGGHGIVANVAVENSYGYATNNSDGIYCNGAAQNCYGYSYGTGAGIFAYTAINCYGYNVGNGLGVQGAVLENCYGYNSGSGYGLDTGGAAHNCFGDSSSGTGIYASRAQNCTASVVNGSYGINATSAENCEGDVNSGAGTAINATTAENCYASTTGSGNGLHCIAALNCYAFSASGTGISATIANSCHADTTTGTAFNVAHNVNSF